MGDVTEKNIIVLDGCGILALSTPMTTHGYGLCAGIGLEFADYDLAQTLSLSLAGSGVSTGQSLYLDELPSPETIAENNVYLVGVRFGNLKRGQYSVTKDGRPYFDVKTGTSSEISVAVNSHETTLGESEKHVGVEMGRISEVGLEFWPTYDFFIMPYIGLRTLVSSLDSERLAIEVMFGVKLGFGATGSRVKDGRGLSLSRILTTFAEEAFDLPYNILNYMSVSEPQGGVTDLMESTLGAGTGFAGSGLLFAPHLQAFTKVQDIGPKRRMLSLYFDADKDGKKELKIAAAVIEGAKLAYLAAGLAVDSGGSEHFTEGTGGNGDGSSFISNGITALNNLLTMASYELISKKYTFVPPLVLGAAQILIGSFLPNSAFKDGLVSGAAVAMGGGATSPDDDLVERTTYTYSPVGYRAAGTATGFIGQVGVRRYLNDTPLFLDFATSSPALMAANLGNFSQRAIAGPAHEGEYSGLALPSQISSGIGVGTQFGNPEGVYGVADLSLRALAEFGQTTGAGALLNGRLGVGFDLGKGAAEFLGVESLALEPSIDVTGHVAAGRDGEGNIRTTTGLDANLNIGFTGRF